MFPSAWKTGIDLLGAGARVVSANAFVMHSKEVKLTSIVHPQTYCTHEHHRKEVHKIQPEPFGEHKALYDASLAICSSVRIVGCVIHAAVVGSRRRSGLRTTEHRVL